MKKKRNKKYNPIRGAELFSDATLKNAVCVFVTGADNLVELYNIKTCKPMVITSTLAKMIERLKYQWSIYLAVFEVDDDDLPGVCGEECELPSRYFQKDLVHGLNDMHKELISAADKEKMFGAGWIASPIPRSIDEETAFKIFEHMGAFNE